MSYTLHLGDCLEIMPRLVERFDGIFTDVPYGTTACSWDTIIPLEPMWEQVKRLLKPNGAFITTASQPFTSVLVMSNLDWFKYEIIWRKNSPSGFSYAKFQPMRDHENVLVFCEDTTVYNKQPTLSKITDRETGKSNGRFGGGVSEHTPGMRFIKANNPDNILLTNVNPRTVIDFDVPARSKGTLHPTQKPVALYEYLIRTYSNPGDTILDFAMGSGTTGVAAIRTGRHFVGIEKEREYFEIAQSRIRSAQPALFVEDDTQTEELAEQQHSQSSLFPAQSGEIAV